MTTTLVSGSSLLREAGLESVGAAPFSSQKKATDIFPRPNSNLVIGGFQIGHIQVTTIHNIVASHLISPKES